MRKRVAVLAIIMAFLVSAVIPAQSGSGPTFSPQQQAPGFRFRIPIIVSNPDSFAYNNASLFMYLHFPPGELTSAYNELSIRNQTGGSVPFVILYQVLQSGYVVGAYVMLMASVTAGASRTYYAYFGNPLSPPPAYYAQTFSRPKSLIPSGFHFSGFGFNYTFFSTYKFGFLSSVHADGGPAEGSSALGAFVLDQSTGWQYLQPASNFTQAVYYQTVNVSGIVVVRTLITTADAFRLTDLLVNPGSLPVNGVSMVDFVDLSALNLIANGTVTYDPVDAHASVQAGDADVRYDLNPSPTIFQAGSFGSVLNDTRHNSLSNSYSSAGSLGIGVEYEFGTLQSLQSASADGEWHLGGKGQVRTLPEPRVSQLPQQSLDSTVPNLAVGYLGTLSFSQANMSGLAGGALEFNYSYQGKGNAFRSASPYFQGGTRYSVPGPSDGNFTNPTIWKVSYTSTTSRDIFASDHFFSPQLSAYTGLVSISNSGPALFGSASLSTGFVKVIGAESAKLVMVYRATDTISSPSNKTFLYVGVGLDTRENGTVAQQLYFPVAGLAPHSPVGKVVQNLTSDGSWQKLTLDLSQIGSRNFQFDMQVNATTNKLDVGSVQLQIAEIALDVEARASDVLTVNVQNDLGSIAPVLPGAQVGFESGATLVIPAWTYQRPQASAAGTFEQTLPDVMFNVTARSHLRQTQLTGHPPPYPAVILVSSVAAFGLNSTLRWATINGQNVTAVSTAGGYVISTSIHGPAPLSVAISYGTVPFALGVVDVNGNAIPADVQIKDSSGATLVTTQVQASGSNLRLVPGNYTAFVMYEGKSVGSATITPGIANGAKIQASVFKIGFLVSDLLGRPVPYALIHLGVSNVFLDGTTDSAGKAFFEVPSGAQVSVSVIAAGSVLASQQLQATVNGAVFSISTSYTPLNIQLAILVIISVFVAIVTLLLRFRDVWAKKNAGGGAGVAK